MKRILLLAAVLLGAPVLSMAAESAKPLDALLRVLADPATDAATRVHILRGMNVALRGRANVPAPAGWEPAYAQLKRVADPALQEQLRMLSVAFGGVGALAELRAVLADVSKPLPARQAALESLVAARDAEALPLLLKALQESGPLRRFAVRGLGNYEEAQVPAALVQAYAQLGSEERRDALAALTSRPAGARALLAAVQAGTVPRGDLSAPLVRQWQDLRLREVNEWIAKNWGAVRASSAERQAEIARFKKFLTPMAIQEGDVHRGRAIFAQACAVCHTLFGAGSKVGPELPGAFEDVDYLLQNILDPNAVIGKDYQQTVIETKNGQSVIGIVEAEDKGSLTLKSLAGPLVLPRSEITKQSVLEISLMPEGLLAGRSETEVRDLFAYLRQHGQVALLAGPAQANDFFNGVDLAHWMPTSAKAWKVEEGAMVGQASADRAEEIVSDLIGEDFRLTAEVQVAGGGVGEIRLRGALEDGGFQGASLALGAGEVAVLRYGKPNTPAVRQPVAGAKVIAGGWTPVEIVARGSKVTVRVGGGEPVALELEGKRTHFGLQVSGAGTVWRVRNPRVEF